MILQRRSGHLPRELRARLDESPLSVAELADGRWAAVTSRALVLADDEGIERHPWHTVARGLWDGESRELTVVWVEGSIHPLRLRTSSDDVAHFTAAFRERVQASVIHAEAAETHRGAQVRAYIRRDENGELLSQVTVAGPWEGDDEDVLVADRTERRARAAVGLPT